MKNKTKITIGIPAYNEEANIGNLLDSIIRQDANGYLLEQIVVLGDGCSDKTEEIVKNYAKKYDFIKPDFDGRRLGKLERLNKLFAYSNSDITVSLDADVLLGDENTIHNLIEKFGPNVGLVAGNGQPVEPTSFFQKILSSFESLWYEARRVSGGGRNIHNLRGRIFAVSKKFAERLRIPNDVLDDYYIYLFCLELGLEFNFAEKAVVYYNQPSTLGDYITQNVRNNEVAENALEHFSADIKQKAFCTRNKDKLRGILIEFRRNPLFTILAVFFILSSKFIISKHRAGINGPWNSIKSTKKKVKSTTAQLGKL